MIFYWVYFFLFHLTKQVKLFLGNIFQMWTRQVTTLLSGQDTRLLEQIIVSHQGGDQGRPGDNEDLMSTNDELISSVVLTLQNSRIQGSRFAISRLLPSENNVCFPYPSCCRHCLLDNNGFWKYDNNTMKHAITWCSDDNNWMKGINCQIFLQ